MVSIELVLYKPILNTELNTPAGSLWRWLERRGNAAVRGAKRQVGVETGRLRNSIHMRHTGHTYGQEVRIGTTGVSYAYIHHEGTKPHLIAPKAGTVLRIRSGRVIHGSVMHPGTKPNRFLSSQTHHFRR
jgi:hypothetical protein